MRLLIKFSSDTAIKIPVGYNYYFQSMLYDLLSDDVIHDKGVGARNYKLFTFSRPIGAYKYSKTEKVLTYEKEVKWLISAVDNEFLEKIVSNLMNADFVEIGEQKLFLSSVEVMKTPPLKIFKSPIQIKMLSPVTIYSTLYDGEGKRKTYYYSPFERDFSTKLKENILRKFNALYNKTPDDDRFEIEAVKPKKEWEKIIEYKGTIIKGWMGRYRLAGNPELISLAYDGGLGSKNSQGFGCFEISEKRAEVIINKEFIPT